MTVEKKDLVEKLAKENGVNINITAERISFQCENAIVGPSMKIKDFNTLDKERIEEIMEKAKMAKNIEIPLSKNYILENVRLILISKVEGNETVIRNNTDVYCEEIDGTELKRVYKTILPESDKEKFENEDGMMSITITKELMNKFNITSKELEKYSLINYPKIEIKGISQVLRELAPGLDFPEEENEKMYVISNPEKTFASGILVNPKAMYEITKELRKKGINEYYILPSSIHELLAVPVEEIDDVKTLINMVTDVNQTQVDEDEVLENAVYKVCVTKPFVKEGEMYITRYAEDGETLIYLKY